MTPADLAHYGRALTGAPDRWRRPLARLLDVSEGFVRLMEQGNRPVPERIEARIRELAKERAKALVDLS